MKLERSNRSVLFALALWTAGILSSAAQDTSSPSDESRYPKRDAAKAAPSAQSIRGTFTVGPGQSVQDAIDRARPGDRVQLLPGVYNEAVTIDFDDIELVGLVENGERPVFDGKGEMNDAVMVSGNNFLIQGIEMRNYKANGVVVNQARNVTFRDVVADNTGKYGVYPVLCDGVLVEDCVVTNVWDAGIYAGQCKNVEIRNSESFYNTIGIETENSVNVLVHNNTAHDNSLGILIVLLPDLPTKVASNARVINNRSYNNNYPNLAPPGQLVSGVEPGLGIVVNAADNTEVTKNVLEGNQAFGVIVNALTDIFPPEQKLDVEPNPDGNYIHGNKFAKNGAGPLGNRFKTLGLTKGGDLFWSGKGKGNGWDEPGVTSYPEQLPAWTGGIPGGGGGGR